MLNVRKIIMWNMVTLDGYFEGNAKWDIDFHSTGWGEELEQLSAEQLNAADMLLFGHTTYEGMASFWPSQAGEVADLMNSIPKIVFSHSLDQADWNNTRIARDAQAEVARLREADGKDVYVFGSADLSAALTRAGLFDEYRLGVNPILLGSGNPLFKQMPNSLRLKLLEARPLQSGCVILRYAPLRDSA